MPDATKNPRSVELLLHDPSWCDQALVEGKRIAGAAGPGMLGIHHIGSTSIAGIAAKPTIDLMPVVASLEDLDGKRGALETLGYRWRGESGIPGRRYLSRDGGGKRLFHVHCFAVGSREITRHLNFRDYLRAHPEEAKAYEAIKQAAAAANPDDTLAYSASKSDWIAACLQRATHWAAQHLAPTALPSAPSPTATRRTPPARLRQPCG